VSLLAHTHSFSELKQKGHSHRKSSRRITFSLRRTSACEIGMQGGGGGRERERERETGRERGHVYSTHVDCLRARGGHCSTAARESRVSEIERSVGVVPLAKVPVSADTAPRRPEHEYLVLFIE
jgi:hypothetical protein